MSTLDTPDLPSVRRLFLQHPEAIGKITAALWQTLAVEIITVVGRDGFALLFLRSRYLCSRQYPWLMPSPRSARKKFRFLKLTTTLDGRDADTAAEASLALLATFLEILGQLIGHAVTSSLLDAAWKGKALTIDAKDAEFGINDQGGRRPYRRGSSAGDNAGVSRPLGSNEASGTRGNRAEQSPHSTRSIRSRARYQKSRH